MAMEHESSSPSTHVLVAAACSLPSAIFASSAFLFSGSTLCVSALPLLSLFSPLLDACSVLAPLFFSFSSSSRTKSSSLDMF